MGKGEGAEAAGMISVTIVFYRSNETGEEAKQPKRATGGLGLWTLLDFL